MTAVACLQVGSLGADPAARRERAVRLVEEAAGADLIVLPGHSAVIDPGGEVVAEAGAEPEAVRAGIDLARVHACRADFPALADRRLGRPVEVAG